MSRLMLLAPLAVAGLAFLLTPAPAEAAVTVTVQSPTVVINTHPTTYGNPQPTYQPPVYQAPVYQPTTYQPAPVRVIERVRYVEVERRDEHPGRGHHRGRGHGHH